MSDKPLLAAFFLEPPEDIAPLQGLAERAGIALHSPVSIYGDEHWAEVRWAASAGVARRRDLPHNVAVTVSFRQSDFLDLTEIDPTKHPVVQAFLAACERWHPPAACVVSHLDQAEDRFIERLAELAFEANGPALARERLGLLYLDADLAAEVAPDSHRERLEVPTGGILVFADRGDKRWF